ncbi:MAG TPA: acetate uptake transporter [Rhodanobacteraceae bacterium]|jgi:succinate-acetate transporter protein|nr:acetate uptake transporter [Rhodanobacteraceae bacterium]
MDKTANASALGYAAFALTLWMNGMLAAGWFDPSDAPLALLLAVVLGGCVMGIAGILQWLRGQTLDAVLFLAFAGFWWVAALAAFVAAHGHPASAGFQGWYAIVWAFLAFCLWLAARKDGVARSLFVLGLCLALFTIALAHWLGFDALTMLAGYLGLVTAIIGIYVAAAELINEMHGHTVLPLGESGVERGTAPVR